MFALVDSMSAYWGRTGNKLTLSLIILLGPIAYILFAFIVREYGLAISLIIINLLIILEGVLIGVFLYKEKLKTKQSIGIIFAFISILLISS